MSNIFELEIFVWLPLGYITLWFMLWRWGPNRGPWLVGPFAVSSNREKVIRHAAWLCVAFAVIPALYALIGAKVNRDFWLYYPLFMLGMVLAYIHVRLRKW